MVSLLLSSKPVYLIDKLEPTFKWLTIAILSAIIVTLVLLFIFKKEKALPIAKKLALAFIVYSLVLGITLLILEICKKYSLSYLDYNYVNIDIIYFVFLPLLVTLFISLLGVLTLYVLATKKSKVFNKLTYVIGGVILASIIVSIVLIYIYYSKNINNSEYYIDYGNLNNLALYGFSIVLLALSIFFAFLLGKNDKKFFDTKSIAFAGICVALSFALSFIKLFELPYGGSVTLFSMLPLMLFAYVYGVKKGLIVGLLYGLLQAIQDPFIIHPAQFLLDYPFAFALIGFAGSLTGFNIANDKPIIKFSISAIIGGTLRFLCHVLSGVFAFGAYAEDAISKAEGIFTILTPFKSTMANYWVYSLVYNSYVFIDIILVIIAGAVLFASKGFRKEVNKLKVN